MAQNVDDSGVNDRDQGQGRHRTPGTDVTCLTRMKTDPGHPEALRPRLLAEMFRVQGALPPPYPLFYLSPVALSLPQPPTSVHPYSEMQVLLF